MDVSIYYSIWDGKQGSHDFLITAAGDYCRKHDLTCPDQLTVKRDTEMSKPYFAEYPGLYFSISHSGEYWTCALSQQEVGLDVQQESDHRKDEKIARRFFHEEEIHWMEMHGFAYFSEIWAYKESYVKYFGTGLVKGLDYFSVTEAEAPGITGNRDVAQKALPFREGYHMVVTTGEPADIILCEL